jgi:hypothetical protein
MTAPGGVCEPPAAMMDDDIKSRMNFFRRILWRMSIARIRFQVGSANGNTIEARKIGGEFFFGPGIGSFFH